MDIQEKNEKQLKQLKTEMEAKLVSIFADFDKVLEKHHISNFSVIKFAIAQKPDILESQSSPNIATLNTALDSDVQASSFELDELESSNASLNSDRIDRVLDCRIEIKDGKLIIECGGN
jgi:hypothetical protein